MSDRPVTNARSRRRAGRLGFADVLLLAVPFLAIFPLRNNDLWWHLAAGRLMVRTGSVPQGDPFSFTGFMGSWIDNEWLSQLVLYGAFRAGGNLGLVLLRIGLYTLVFLLIREWLRLGRGPSAFLPSLAVGIALSFGWWELRPSLFSILGTLSLVAILERIRRTGRGFAALPVLFLVWASVHPGFLFGACILVGTVAALYAERILSDWPKWTGETGVPTRLAAWTGVAVAATLVNPYGWKVYSQQVAIAGNTAYRALLDEWAPPGSAFLALVLATLAALIVLRFRRTAPASLVPILGAAILSTTAVRFEEYFALVAVPGVLLQIGGSGLRRPRIVVLGALLGASLLLGLRSPLSEGLGEGHPSSTTIDTVEARVDARLRRNAVLVAGVLAASALVSIRGGRARGWPGRHGRSRATVAVLAPVVAVAASVAWVAPRVGRVPDDYVEAGRYPTTCLSALAPGAPRVFNRLSWGGWLIWKADVRTFVDGRCWGQPIFFEYQRCHTSACPALLDAYGIDRVIVAKSDATTRVLASDPAWRLTCEDAASVVFARDLPLRAR
ncbi:MAG TPA: hypothetical protein VF139_06120 [Candidatus Polarisedimenticolaceae bacterium]